MAERFINDGNSQASDGVRTKRRALAELLMRNAMSTQPVGHWTQGLARFAQGAVGLRDLYRDEEARSKGGNPLAHLQNAAMTSSQAAPAASPLLQAGANPGEAPVAQAYAPLPRRRPAELDRMQSVGPGDIMNMQEVNPAASAARPGSTDTLDGYLTKLYGHESNNNPNARAPTSSATGLAQFTTGTWRELMRARPDLGLTPDGRTDPDQARRAAAAFTEQNAKILERAGFSPSHGNLYVTHFLGQDGGPRFLRGLATDPNAPATSHVTPAAASANRRIFFNRDGSPRTLQEVYDLQTRRFRSPEPAQGEPQQRPPGWTSAPMPQPRPDGASPRPQSGLSAPDIDAAFADTQRMQRRPEFEQIQRGAMWRYPGQPDASQQGGAPPPAQMGLRPGDLPGSDIGAAFADVERMRQRLAPGLGWPLWGNPSQGGLGQLGSWPQRDAAPAPQETVGPPFDQHPQNPGPSAPAPSDGGWQEQSGLTPEEEWRRRQISPYDFY